MVRVHAVRSRAQAAASAPTQLPVNCSFIVTVRATYFDHQTYSFLVVAACLALIMKTAGVEGQDSRCKPLMQAISQPGHTTFATIFEAADVALDPANPYTVFVPEDGTAEMPGDETGGSGIVGLFTAYGVNITTTQSVRQSPLFSQIRGVTLYSMLCALLSARCAAELLETAAALQEYLLTALSGMYGSQDSRFPCCSCCGFFSVHWEISSWTSAHATTHSSRLEGVAAARITSVWLVSCSFRSHRM